MNRVVSLLFLSVLAVTSYAPTGPSLPQRLLCWQAGRKLRWADFQAPANVLPPEDPLFATSAASCAPVLQVIGTKDETGRNNFFVTAALDRSRSWVRDPAATRSERVLAHEQVHFDICELIARRLRQHITQEYQAGGDVFAPVFRQELQGLLDEQASLNARYDHETAHGLLPMPQQQWQQQLVRELAELAAYASTASDCPYGE
jgi:hypothetical protein